MLLAQRVFVFDSYSQTAHKTIVLIDNPTKKLLECLLLHTFANTWYWYEKDNFVSDFIPLLFLSFNHFIVIGYQLFFMWTFCLCTLPIILWGVFFLSALFRLNKYFISILNAPSVTIALIFCQNVLHSQPLLSLGCDEFS